MNHRVWREETSESVGEPYSSIVREFLYSRRNELSSVYEASGGDDGGLPRVGEESQVQQ